MNNNKSFDSAQDRRPAGFWIRLLAFLLEFAIELVPTTLFALLVSTSSSLEDLIFRLVIYLTVWLIPFIIVGIALYIPWFTSRFGGTLGKIVTGLRVTDENGKLLNYKRAFFRQNIAYAFSSLLFGWGFWSVARDKEKLAWHDKAVGSKVWKTKNTWPIALVLLIALLVTQGYFLNKAFTNLTFGPLKNIFGDKNFGRTIRAYTIISTSRSTASQKPETVLLDTNYGQAVTVTIGADVYITCGELAPSITIDPPTGILETPTGTFNLPSNVCWYYKAIGPGKAKITITGTLRR